MGLAGMHSLVCYKLLGTKMPVSQDSYNCRCDPPGDRRIRFCKQYAGQIQPNNRYHINPMYSWIAKSDITRCLPDGTMLESRIDAEER